MPPKYWGARLAGQAVCALVFSASALKSNGLASLSRNRRQSPSGPLKIGDSWRSGRRMLAFAWNEIAIPMPRGVLVRRVGASACPGRQ